MAQDEKQIQKRNRLTYMILSVVIAITAWALVAFANNPDISKTFYNLDVVIKGNQSLKSRELIVINEDDINNLSVKLSGKRRDLIEAIDKTVVEVDVSDISGPGVYNLRGSVILPNSRISIEKTMFETIPITVDEYITADIPVHIVQSGNIAGKIVQPVPESETVSILGAKSELELISEAVVNINVAELSESGELKYEIYLSGGDGEELSNLKTVTKPDITVNNIIYDYKELPVKPVLHETLKNIHEIDYEAMMENPVTVGVGVLPGVNAEELKVIIDEYTEEETEYEIIEEEGIYLPQKNIKLRPVFKEKF